jgi:hypothetical protein
MGTALSLAGSIDGLIPIAAVFACWAICAILAFIIFFVTLITTPALRNALTKKGKNEDGDYSSTRTLLYYYLPGFGALVSGLNIPLQALLDLIKSIATLGALDWLRLAILILLGALAGLWMAEHQVIIPARNQIWTCDPVYSARHVILEFLNIVRLIIGSVISTWNAIYAFDWSLVWVFVRVTIDCTIVDGPLVLEQFGEDLGIALELLFVAIANYLEGNQGPLLTSGIDFVPFVEQIGVTGTSGDHPLLTLDLANTTALLLDCACLYLNWSFTAALGLVGDPALAQAGTPRFTRCPDTR